MHLKGKYKRGGNEGNQNGAAQRRNKVQTEMMTPGSKENDEKSVSFMRLGPHYSSIQFFEYLPSSNITSSPTAQLNQISNLIKFYKIFNRFYGLE